MIKICGQQQSLRSSFSAPAGIGVSWLLHSSQVHSILLRQMPRCGQHSNALSWITGTSTMQHGSEPVQPEKEPIRYSTTSGLPALLELHEKLTILTQH